MIYFWFDTTQFEIHPRFHGDKHFEIVSWRLDQNCAFMSVHVFSKSWPSDLVFDIVFLRLDLTTLFLTQHDLFLILA